jgi:Uma2 family endonuclease
LRFGLQVYYRDNPQVYVGANILIYYVEGDPGESVAPDVFVSLGVPTGERRTYLVWKEGKVPDLVIEIASQTTHWRDLVQKKGLYEWLGVREYVMVDPAGGECFEPPLQLFRLEEGEYTRVLDEPLISAVTGLELRLVDHWLRLVDPRTGEMLPTEFESFDAWQAATARAEQEAEARRQAEARAAHEAAARQVEAEARRQAEARAQALEAEVARLREELARRGG